MKNTQKFIYFTIVQTAPLRLVSIHHIKTLFIQALTLFYLGYLANAFYTEEGSKNGWFI